MLLVSSNTNSDPCKVGWTTRLRSDILWGEGGGELNVHSNYAYMFKLAVKVSPGPVVSLVQALTDSHHLVATVIKDGFLWIHLLLQESREEALSVNDPVLGNIQACQLDSSSKQIHYGPELMGDLRRQRETATQTNCYQLCDRVIHPLPPPLPPGHGRYLVTSVYCHSQSIFIQLHLIV